MARKRARHGKPPPETVIIVGCGLAWSEAVARAKELRPVEFLGRNNCPNNCVNRDLDHERWMGLHRICLRCLTSTDDPPHWRMPVPLMVVIATDRERRKAISLAQRRFSGREQKRLGLKPGTKP